MKNYNAPDVIEQEVVERVKKDEAVKALILYNIPNPRFRWGGSNNYDNNL